MATDVSAQLIGLICKGQAVIVCLTLDNVLTSQKGEDFNMVKGPLL